MYNNIFTNIRNLPEYIPIVTIIKRRDEKIVPAPIYYAVLRKFKWQSVDIVEFVSHALLLGVHVEAVVGGRLCLYGDILHHLKAIAFEADALHGIVSHEAHLSYSKLMEYLGAHAVVALVGLVAELEIGIDGINALLLKLVSPDLVHQADSAALLTEIEDNAASLLLDHLHGLVELLAAVAALRSEDIACGAR